MKTVSESGGKIFRRLPQKIDLIVGSSGVFCFLASGLVLIPGGILLTLLYSRGLSGYFTGVLVFLLLLTCFAICHISKYFLPLLLSSMGWYPNIEYHPVENQVIITDLTGVATLFRPESRITIYREGLREVGCVRCDPGVWRIVLVTKRGDKISIVSSVRNSLEAAEELALKIGAMLELPFVREG
ncbi:MAG: hypothetical protein HQM09_15620 [Candidatus Riflebacteria bacterium]|nr:hypothetical protein [Candidatus Riflebacteria bacterium]